MTTRVKLAAPALADLQFWKAMNCWEAMKQIKPPPPTTRLFTDASDLEWGAWWGNQCLSHKWEPQVVPWSINEKELLAIFLAFRYFAGFFEGKIKQISKLK